jgi:CDP-diglyceride synthetase
LGRSDQHDHYLRGIAANVLVVLPWLLLAAALATTIYPTQDALKQADDARFLPIAVWVALVLGVMLVIWAVIRSWQAGLSTLLSWYAALALPVIVWLIYARLTILGISANSADYWIRNLYFWSGLLLLILSLFLMPNANSLHRLYRDRLSDAFLFKSKPQDDGSGASRAALRRIRPSWPSSQSLPLPSH